MSGTKISPSAQARRDREKSSKMPVKKLSDMTPEERQKAIDEITNVDRSRAERQALKHSGLVSSAVKQ